MIAVQNTNTVCRECLKEQPESEFKPFWTRPSGVCRTCVNRMKREDRAYFKERFPEEYREWLDVRNYRRRERYRAYPEALERKRAKDREYYATIPGYREGVKRRAREYKQRLRQQAVEYLEKNE